MKKTALIIILLALIVVPAAAGSFGAGLKLGVLGSAFDLNFHASLYLTRSLEIEPAFDFFTGAGMITATAKYNFRLSSVVPYVGAGIGFAFADNSGAFTIPMVGGVAIPLGAGFYLDLEIRPVLFVGEGTNFSFGALGGMTYYF